MRRLPPLLALPLIALTARAQPPPATAPEQPAAPAPHTESLRDLRLDVAQSKLSDAPALCDRLRIIYEKDKAAAEVVASAAPAGAAPTPAQQQASHQAAVDSLMACYCLFAKSQVLALRHDIPAATEALQSARGDRASDPNSANPRLKPIWDELDTLTSGLLLEMQKKYDDAVQTYLPATYAEAESLTRASGRLAMIEFNRGRLDKAKSWALIHSDDPTSEYVLAELAVKAKTPLVAQRHVTNAIGQIQKQLQSGKEYLPLYYADAAAIVALHRKLPPLPKATPKAAPKPAAAPNAPNAGTPAAPAPAKPAPSTGGPMMQ